MSLRVTALLSAAGIGLATTGLYAQSPSGDSTVIGVVVSNAATRAPIEGAELRIVGRDTAFLSDYVGEITFRRPRNSTMQLKVARAGFGAVDTTFQVGSVDWMQVIISLAPAPTAAEAQPLPPAAVVAAKPAAHLRGFEERRAKGRGRYVTPEQLREGHDRKLLEVLERIPGLSSQASSTGVAMLVARSGPTSIVEGGSETYANRVRGQSSPAQSGRANRAAEDGAKPGYCAVAVFVDGMYLPDVDVGSFRTTGFDAVEYYTAANVPPEFRRPGTQCGVVLLWSR